MGVDINTELQTIRQGRYGNDIRIAIHDALEKIADQEIEPYPGGANVAVATLRLNGTAETVIGVIDAVNGLAATVSGVAETM